MQSSSNHHHQHSNSPHPDAAAVVVDEPLPLLADAIRVDANHPYHPSTSSQDFSPLIVNRPIPKRSSSVNAAAGGGEEGGRRGGGGRSPPPVVDPQQQKQRSEVMHPSVAQPLQPQLTGTSGLSWSPKPTHPTNLSGTPSGTTTTAMMTTATATAVATAKPAMVTNIAAPPAAAAGVTTTLPTLGGTFNNKLLTQLQQHHQQQQQQQQQQAGVGTAASASPIVPLPPPPPHQQPQQTSRGASPVVDNYQTYDFSQFVDDTDETMTRFRLFVEDRYAGGGGGGGNVGDMGKQHHAKPNNNHSAVSFDSPFSEGGVAARNGGGAGAVGGGGAAAGGLFSPKGSAGQQGQGAAGAGATAAAGAGGNNLRWAASHPLTLAYHHPVIEEEFAVFYFSDRRSLSHTAAPIFGLTFLMYLILNEVFVSVDDHAALAIPCAVTLFGLILVVIWTILLQQKFDRLRQEMWDIEAEQDAFQLFRDDSPVRQALRRNAWWYEVILMASCMSLAIVVGPVVYLAPPLEGSWAHATHPGVTHPSFHADSLLLMCIMYWGSLRPPRFVRFLMCLCVLVGVGLGMLFFREQRVWQRTLMSFAFVAFAVVTAVVNTRFNEIRSRENYQLYVQQRARATASAWLKKRIKVTLAAQVPPGMTESVKDRDGMWGMSPTLAICDVTIDRFYEWGALASPYDIASTLRSVFDAVDGAFVLSDCRASRYHSFGDSYRVGQPLEGFVDVTKFRGMMKFAAFASMTGAAALRESTYRFCTYTSQDRKLRPPALRVATHIGVGCSVTVWGSKSVVLAGPAVSTITQLTRSDHRAPLMVNNLVYELTRIEYPLTPVQDPYVTFQTPYRVLLTSEAAQFLWKENPAAPTAPMSDSFVCYAQLPLKQSEGMQPLPTSLLTDTRRLRRPSEATFNPFSGPLSGGPGRNSFEPDRFEDAGNGSMVAAGGGGGGGEHHVLPLYVVFVVVETTAPLQPPPLDNGTALPATSAHQRSTTTSVAAMNNSAAHFTKSSQSQLTSERVPLYVLDEQATPCASAPPLPPPGQLPPQQQNPQLTSGVQRTPATPHSHPHSRGGPPLPDMTSFVITACGGDGGEAFVGETHHSGGGMMMDGGLSPTRQMNSHHPSQAAALRQSQSDTALQQLSSVTAPIKLMPPLSGGGGGLPPPPAQAGGSSVFTRRHVVVPPVATGTATTTMVVGSSSSTSSHHTTNRHHHQAKEGESLAVVVATPQGMGALSVAITGTTTACSPVNSNQVSTTSLNHSPHRHVASLPQQQQQPQQNSSGGISSTTFTRPHPPIPSYPLQVPNQSYGLSGYRSETSAALPSAAVGGALMMRRSSVTASPTHYYNGGGEGTINKANGEGGGDAINQRSFSHNAQSSSSVSHHHNQDAHEESEQDDGVDSHRSTPSDEEGEEAPHVTSLTTTHAADISVQCRRWFGGFVFTFVDPKLEENFDLWSREAFDESRCFSSIGLNIAASVILVGYLQTLPSLQTFEAHSPLPYAVVALIMAVAQLLVLLLTRSLQLRLPLIILQVLFFGFFLTAPLVMGKSKTMMDGDAIVPCMLLLDGIRQARPHWHTPLRVCVSTCVFLLAVLIRVILVPPSSSQYEFWITVLWIPMIGVSTLLSTWTVDRFRREEYILLLRAKTLHEGLREDYERYEDAIQHVTPKGIAHSLVRSAKRDLLRGELFPQQGGTSHVHAAAAAAATAAGNTVAGAGSFTIYDSTKRSFDQPSALSRILGRLRGEYFIEKRVLMTPAFATHIALFQCRKSHRSRRSNNGGVVGIEGLRGSLHRLVKVQQRIACMLADHDHYSGLQLVKSSVTHCMIATNALREDDDSRMLLDFVCRVHKELQSVDGLQHRAVVSSGPVVGCVLGSRSVSFEYYGAAVCTASRLLEEVPWGQAICTEALLRNAQRHVAANTFKQQRDEAKKLGVPTAAIWTTTAKAEEEAVPQDESVQETLAQTTAKKMRPRHVDQMLPPIAAAQQEEVAEGEDDEEHYVGKKEGNVEKQEVDGGEGGSGDAAKKSTNNNNNNPADKNAKKKKTTTAGDPDHHMKEDDVPVSSILRTAPNDNRRRDEGALETNREEEEAELIMQQQRYIPFERMPLMQLQAEDPEWSVRRPGGTTTTTGANVLPGFPFSSASGSAEPVLTSPWFAGMHVSAPQRWQIARLGPVRVRFMEGGEEAPLPHGLPLLAPPGVVSSGELGGGPSFGSAAFQR